jgi:RNA polymerase sigma-70 factor (ECF subfamily)
MSQYFDDTTIETPTTAELVLSAQAGDREAFGQLAVRFEGMVYATALRRLRNASEARELCQDVLMQAMQKVGQLRQPERFGGWLRSITTNMAVNRLTRRPQAYSLDPEIMESACTDGSTPESFALVREERQRVRDGLGRLREMDRSALEAFYLDGQSLLEMSDRFASPVGTIKRRLHVARKRLAAELEEPVAV